MEEKRCYMCKGRLHNYNTLDLQVRFTNGIKKHVCEVCGDICNAAVMKSREFYGIDKKAYQIVLRRFKRDKKIPLFSHLNAMQNEMIEIKRASLLRLMFWMDIRAVKKLLPS